MDFTAKDVIHSAAYIVMGAGVFALIVGAIARTVAIDVRNKLRAGLGDRERGQALIAKADAMWPKVFTLGAIFLIVGIVQFLVSR